METWLVVSTRLASGSIPVFTNQRSVPPHRVWAHWDVSPDTRMVNARRTLAASQHVAFIVSWLIPGMYGSPRTMTSPPRPSVNGTGEKARPDLPHDALTARCMRTNPDGAQS